MLPFRDDSIVSMPVDSLRGEIDGVKLQDRVAGPLISLGWKHSDQSYLGLPIAEAIVAM